MSFLRGFTLALSPLFGASLLSFGCGDDGGKAKGDDAGDVDAAPEPAPFGLDSRPSNTTCLAKDRPVLDTAVTLERQWPGVSFSQPIFLTQAPGNNDEWFVVQRQGTVRAFPQDATGNGDTRTFATVNVNAAGEGGLLSMAFHPEWPAKREAYLSYTRSIVGGDPNPVCLEAGFSFTSVISRFTSTNGGTSLDQGPDEILKVGQPFGNHDGGHIAFGPDGYLYFGLGDGGSGNDPCEAGQNLASPLGKMLRIDVNAGAGSYQVPDDNPFVGTQNARSEIWAYGLRNPWRWSFDQETGEQWLGDVGQGTWEEIDLIGKGGNYGWKTCEGFHRRGSQSQLCDLAGARAPVVAHGRDEARSITGGYVYRGSAMPSLVGTYIYGDYKTGTIWAIVYDDNNEPTSQQIAQVAGDTLVSFAQGNDGEVYTVQINGVISKLVPSGEAQVDTFPKRLSETGCVDPNDPTRMAAGLIPYTVNSKLWSDGADKERYLALPDGETITINEDHDWDLPIGSVVVKSFLVNNTPVETRLFMRHEDGGWGGYSYEWDDDGTDATLLPAGKVKPIAGATAWAYPSRSQCIQCHSNAAGGTIGLETAQLNGDAVYPSTNRVSNQLATLEHIGMFSAPLGDPEDAPRLVDPTGSASAEERARSYLHANCSHCHRPEGGGEGDMDLRYENALAATNTCNVEAGQGSVDGADTILVPGAPNDSVLSRRMHATDAKRMPPVGVTVTDPVGTAVIDEWIESLSSCPE